MEISGAGGLFSTYSICSNAAGIAGNFFFLIFWADFREPFCICFICITNTNIQKDHKKQVNRTIFWAALYICLVELLNMSMLKMLGLLFGVFTAFAAVFSISICLFQPPNRQTFVGYLSVISLISMFASPLFIINLVIRTRSVEYMPFYLSLATFLMSLSFFAYGMFKKDPFIYVPNGIGGVLGIIQLVLYWRYSRPNEEPTRPLLESNA
uniref:MtN3 n=1 Tax=Solanum tuberosum TaxID=4113 RepID=M1B1P2_SOLTU